MIIRPEAPEEFRFLHQFIETAFQTAEVSDGNEQFFVDRLRASANYIPELALVAVEDDEIIGHVMLTRTVIEDDGERHETLLLAPLSVALEARGRGVGEALVNRALKKAVDLGHTSAVLVGDPFYYRRFGFVPASEFAIGNTDDIPADYVLACELVPGGLDDVAGAIVFTLDDGGSEEE